MESFDAKTQDRSYLESYIGLSDSVVQFTPEVTEYFTSKLGAEEFGCICRLSCQAPSYTSIRIDLLKVSREEALELMVDLLKPYNATLVEENRKPINPYLHESIPELVIIPPCKSVCPSVEELKQLPIVLVDRMCGESVLRGSDIFVKGVRAVEKNCVKGQRVCIAIDVCNNDLPRGTDIFSFTGNNIILGEGIIQLNRTEVFSAQSGLCIDHIHRLSFDLPPLQLLPDVLLMQNFPSLITSRILDPHSGDTVLDCCAAPGNKWSHLCMLMKDEGIVLGMDRSLKKSVENLLQIKQKFKYHSLQIRYQDMTKGVICKDDEVRLMTETDRFSLGSKEETISPMESKGFHKKMVRIQKQKERKQREQQMKRGVECVAASVECVSASVDEQKALTLDRYERLNQKQKTKNQKELELLDEHIASSVPSSLRHLLLAGIASQTARIPGYPREVFDRILLDPPCSALGLRPRLSHNVSLDELYGYRTYQRQFIRVAVELLREGGYLVYSTCTFDPLENEENVKYIIDTYPMELVPVESAYRFGKDGLSDCGLNEEQCRMVQRYNMTEDCNSIGFFISKFRKTRSMLENSK